MSRGERLSRDRLIEKCAGVEQTVRRRDGRIEKIPPAPSPDEIAHREAEKEAGRGDRARRALPTTRDRVVRERSVARIVALEGERKKLADEAEFYPGGRPLPPKLKSDIDRNDAALKAQRAFLQNQQGEEARVNELYDEQLAKLRKLWKR